jgi:hypothetical protein
MGPTVRRREVDEMAADVSLEERNLDRLIRLFDDVAAP